MVWIQCEDKDSTLILQLLRSSASPVRIFSVSHPLPVWSCTKSSERAWPRQVTQTGQRDILYNRMSCLVFRDSAERGWPLPGSRMGIGQWVVSNCSSLVSSCVFFFSLCVSGFYTTSMIIFVLLILLYVILLRLLCCSYFQPIFPASPSCLMRRLALSEQLVVTWCLGLNHYSLLSAQSRAWEVEMMTDLTRNY